MATAWGRASTWPDRSLLSYHHNETWGGEKFFTVLERMQMDPARNQDILEFKYIYRLPRQWPLWMRWALTAVVLAGAYLLFSISLEDSIEQVLRSLDFVLRS